MKFKRDLSTQLEAELNQCTRPMLIIGTRQIGKE